MNVSFNALHAVCTNGGEVLQWLHADYMGLLKRFNGSIQTT